MMRAVLIGLLFLVGCAAVRYNFRGDVVNEERLAAIRAMSSLAVTTDETELKHRERFTVRAELRHDGDSPAQICTGRGVSFWFEPPDRSRKIPLHIYGTTTDVLCANSLTLEARSSQQFRDELVVPLAAPVGEVLLCAGMEFDYCGSGAHGCAYSFLTAPCKRVKIRNAG